MHRIAYPLFLLLLTACATATPQQSLLDKANGGDAAAQIEMGYKFCDTHPGVYTPDTTQALSWWEKAAASKDKLHAAEANEALGMFYFGQYVSPTNYAEGAKPIALCRGDTPVTPDTDKAIGYFKKCADAGAGNGNMSCQTQLAWVYDHKKDYEKAYFWYATVMASALQQTAKEDAWSLPVVDKLTLSHPLLKDMSEQKYAAKAAKHLSTKKVAALNERAQTYVQIYGPRWLSPEDRVYDTAKPAK